MIAGVKDGAVLVDAGKGSFSAEAIEEAGRRKLPVYRASIQASFEGQVAMLLKTEDSLAREVGRRKINGVSVVSGSLMGCKGDLVVDNFLNPTQVFGVADGTGDFNREPSPKEILNRQSLEEWIRQRQGSAS
jgi:hypothetical protein